MGGIRRAGWLDSKRIKGTSFLFLTPLLTNFIDHIYLILTLFNFFSVSHLFENCGSDELRKKLENKTISALVSESKNLELSYRQHHFVCNAINAGSKFSERFFSKYILWFFGRKRKKMFHSLQKIINLLLHRATLSKDYIS